MEDCSIFEQTRNLTMWMQIVEIFLSSIITAYLIFFVVSWSFTIF